MEIPSLLFWTLLEVADRAVSSATWFPADEYGTAEMILPSEVITALSEALDDTEEWIMENRKDALRREAGG